MKSTDTIQNILGRLLEEVTLEMESPPPYILNRYAQAKSSLMKAHLNFQALNGMMDYINEKANH